MLRLTVASLALIGSFSFRIVDIATPEFSLAIRHSDACRRR